MNNSNMKMISMEEVQALPNGTRVFVRCVGAEWHMEEKECWNLKQEDGLHYEEEDEEHTVSFAYDYDYDAENMEIICYVEETGCRCCNGDKAAYWENIANNAFVERRGKMVVTVKDNMLKFIINYCPICGRRLK